MNAIKLILVIVAVLGVLAMCVTPAAAQTKTWDRDAGTDSWHDGDNWDPPGEPGAGNDVVIPKNTPTAYLVVISTDDAACKTLDIEATSRLEITGKTLTLGSSTANTTSTLDAGTGNDDDGTMRFVISGSAFGRLWVHKTVTFTGGGTIDAPESTDAGMIERAGTGSTGGIIIDDATTPDNAVFGNITLLCDVENNGDGDRFGVNKAGQLMIFGDSAAAFCPVEMEISGDGEFSARLDGKIQFRIVTFASSAPTWVIRDAEIEVTDDAGPTYWLNVPFDIDMASKSGVLDIDHDFRSTGFLHILADESETHTIEVAKGKVAVFNPIPAISH